MDELSPSALHSQSKGDGGQFLDAVEAQLYNTHGTTGVKRSATDIVIVNNTNIYWQHKLLWYCYDSIKNY